MKKKLACIGLLVFAGMLYAAEAKKNMQELIEQLESKKPSEREQAAIELGALKNSDAVNALASHIADSKTAVRLAVIEALSAIGGESVFAPLITVLDDKNEKILIAAIKGIGRLKRVEALPAFERLLSHKDEAIRIEVIKAISTIENEQAVKPLQTALNDKKLEVRLAAIDALVLYEGDAQDALCSALQDKHVDVRRNAIDALRLVGDETVVPRLKEVISDKELKIRIAAISALGIIGGREAADILVSACNDDNVKVRIYVCRILGALKDKNAVPALEKILLNDPAKAVRNAAAVSLAEIGLYTSLGPLNEMLLINTEENIDVLIDSSVSLIRQHHENRKDREKVKKQPVPAKEKQQPVLEKDKTAVEPQAQVNDGKTNQMKLLYGEAVKLYKEGNYTEAIEGWKKVLAIKPDHEQSRRMIERAKEKMQTP